MKTLEQTNDYLVTEFLPWCNQVLTVLPASPDDAHRSLEKQHDLAAMAMSALLLRLIGTTRLARTGANRQLSHVETRLVNNDYTLQFESQRYQIERKDICTGLRGADVRVEQRRDGTVAVRFRDRYLAISRCEPRPKPAQPRPGRQSPASAKPRQRSDWNQDFDLKKAPKVWQAAQASGVRVERD